MKKRISVVLAAAAVMVMGATAAMAAEGEFSKVKFLKDNNAMISAEVGAIMGNMSGGVALSFYGIGGKVGIGGHYNNHDVSAVIDSRTYPGQVLASTFGVRVPFLGSIDTFIDAGVGFADKKLISGTVPANSQGANVSGGGSMPVLSIGGGLSVNTGVRAWGNDIIINAGYSKLQGVFGGVGLKF